MSAFDTRKAASSSMPMSHEPCRLTQQTKSAGKAQRAVAALSRAAAHRSRRSSSRLRQSQPNSSVRGPNEIVASNAASEENSSERIVLRV